MFKRLNGLVEIPVTSFIVALSGALAPGPLMLTTVRESSHSRSFKPGLLLSLGHAFAEVPITLLLTYGLLNVKGEFLPFISLIGGAVLIFMGLLASFKASEGNMEAVNHLTTHGHRMVLLGAIISVSNPYWITWWLTIGAAYISKALVWGALGIILFYLSHEIGDLVVIGSISKAMARGARSLSERGFKILIAICNLAIIVIGASFVFEGLSSLI